MIKVLNITLLFLFVSLTSSCAHRMTIPLPDSDLETDRERVAEFEKYEIQRQGTKDMLFDHIRMGKNKTKYRLDTAKYLFDEVSPLAYHRLSTPTWQKYLAYLSLIPMYVFGQKMISENANFTNISLSLLSAGGFFWGLSAEESKNNRIIDKYNQDLKIKLDIIKLPL